MDIENKFLFCIKKLSYISSAHIYQIHPLTTQRELSIIIDIMFIFSHLSAHREIEIRKKLKSP